MGLISSIKDLLGIEERDRGRSTDTGTTVAVEREPATETERATTGVSTESAVEETVSTEPEPPSAATSDAGDGEPVDSLKGIGSSYAERLADAGVHTVADLAAADADALGEETGLGAGRVESWIEQARARNR